MLKYITGVFFILTACTNDPSPPLSPDEELSTFQIAPGYRIELAAFEPMVQDPVVIKFDEDGRLWVVEMRGFMPDIDGNGEDARTGRVSILFDNNQDGLMDSSTVFVDSLVLPRALAVVRGGALVAEDAVLWYFEDTNGDFKADKRTIVDPEYGNQGMVEHSANGLWRGMDNWIYNAKSKYRYQRQKGKWIREETEFRGQWGICHDNSGRLYYNYNWSQLHMDLVPPNYLSRNSNHKPSSGIDYSLSIDRRVFPIRSNRAINRGYIEGTLDAEGKIIEFASACAPFIYRGDMFDAGVIGNAFVCEPTGNLVKRNLIKQDSLYPTAENAYHGKEFLASTDERFRPVWLSSGPDGALYIVDMYRGIVQHGPYMSPYLREVSLKRKLDKPINLGRIWRIVPKGNSHKNPPLRLSQMTIGDLVKLLEHDNGWYRDTAQRLLVEREDTTAFSMLKNLVTISQNRLARLHALWALEGLGYHNADFLLKFLEDPQTEIQETSLRLLEAELKGNLEIQERLEQVMLHSKIELPSLQKALTAGELSYPVKQQVLLQVLSEHLESQVYRDAVLSGLQDQEHQFLQSLLTQPEWQKYSSDKEIMVEQLAAAIATKADPEELIELLPYLDVETLSWKQTAILNGLSFYQLPADSPTITLPQAPELFNRSFNNKEQNQKISKVAAIFNWPGKAAVATETNEKVLFDIDPEVLARGRNLYLTLCASCHGNDGGGMSRFAPPLSSSEWVTGNAERLSRILLHGIEGPVEVNGKIYDVPEILPTMPAFATTPPEDLAAIMTYIRQAWGHNASPVNGRTVGGIRIRTQGKVTPWTATELLEIGIEKN